MVPQLAGIPVVSRMDNISFIGPSNCSNLYNPIEQICEISPRSPCGKLFEQKKKSSLN